MGWDGMGWDGMANGGLHLAAWPWRPGPDALTLTAWPWRPDALTPGGLALAA